MTKITEAYRSNPRRPLVICDFSPPRGASPDSLDVADLPGADFISVNYNPGRVPRAESAITAHLLHQRTGRDVVFTLAVRDMNPLALQSHILGAALLGLENLLILGGDPFPPSKQPHASGVGAMPPIALMKAVRNMNNGLDRRGRPLDDPTDLRIGGAIDLSSHLDRAARLTHEKIKAGAQFFVTQPIFTPQQITSFHSAYNAVAGEPVPTPVFYGLQILSADSPSFSPVPDQYQHQLEQGRSGEDIALEVWETLNLQGADSLYLIPPVGPRGARDYAAAARLLDRIRT